MISQSQTFAPLSVSSETRHRRAGPAAEPSSSAFPMSPSSPNVTMTRSSSHGLESCTQRGNDPPETLACIRPQSDAVVAAHEHIEKAKASSAAESGGIQQKLDRSARAIQEGRPTSPTVQPLATNKPEDEPPSTRPLAAAFGFAASPGAATNPSFARVRGKAPRHPALSAPGPLVLLSVLLHWRPDRLMRGHGTYRDEPAQRSQSFDVYFGS